MKRTHPEAAARIAGRHASNQDNLHPAHISPEELAAFEAARKKPPAMPPSQWAQDLIAAALAEPPKEAEK